MVKQLITKAVTQTDVAAYIMEELDIARPYILAFEANNQVPLFDIDGEVFGLIEANSELQKKIDWLEKEHHVKVYAVTREILPAIGSETYSFLCVSPYAEDWEHSFRRIGRVSQASVAYAYVWNVHNDICSEFGYVELRSYCGNLKRVG